MGAEVLLDSHEVNRIGSHDLLFYDADCSQPKLCLPIGPRLKIEEQREDPFAATSGGRLSLAARLSMAGAGSCIAYDILLQGGVTHVITFDTEESAATFLRDFNVRQKLSALSVRTWRKNIAFESLQQ